MALKTNAYRAVSLSFLLIKPHLVIHKIHDSLSRFNDTLKLYLSSSDLVIFLNVINPNYPQDF